MIFKEWCKGYLVVAPEGCSWLESVCNMYDKVDVKQAWMSNSHGCMILVQGIHVFLLKIGIFG